jgi:tetratricopeptide (TPR) repeat protein
MKTIITIIALLAVTITQAQTNRNIDSLQKIFETAKADTDKINIAISLSKEYSIAGNNEQSIKYAESALAKSKSVNYKQGMAKSYARFGIAYMIMADYERAISNYLTGINVCKEIGDKKTMVKLYNNMGITYERRGDYENQINSYINCLKISEEIKDSLSIAIIYQNIGNVYMKGGKNNEALDYFNKSLKIYIVLNDKSGEGSVYGSMADAYKNKEEYDRAMDIAKKSLMINKSIDDKWQISGSLYSIAGIYFKMNNYGEALKNYIKALDLCNQTGDENGASNSYKDIGNIYLKKNNLEKAHQYLSFAIDLSKEIKDNSNLMESYKLMSELFNRRNDCGKSYDYYLKYSTLKDSINSYETVMKIESLQTKYESDKKEKILALEQQAKDEKQKAKFERERIIRYSFMAGFVLILGIAFFIFKGYRDKVKSNRVISEQKKLVEEKNHEITDSIKYASRVQQAILPPADFIKEVMPEHYIYFSPKDIVSGDFYFVDKREDKLFWASCDATGHGVSGSLISMLGSNALSGIIKDGEVMPSRILDKLNERINQSLHKTSDESIRDGMDVSFCCLDTTLNKLHWAGANNPLWIIRGTDIIEFKADKMPIGQMYKTDSYKNHEIELQAGDTIVSFSDGYCDQFSKDGKKFMKKRFRELLLSMTEKSMSAQKEIITNTMNEWRSGGTVEQTDDLLVFAVRV